MIISFIFPFSELFLLYKDEGGKENSGLRGSLSALRTSFLENSISLYKLLTK